MYSVTPLSLPYSQSSTQFLHLLQPSLQSLHNCSGNCASALPFRKAINRSGSGEILRSLPGPSLFVCACWLPDAGASSSVERQALPDGVPLHCSGRLSSVPTVPCLQLLRHGQPTASFAIQYLRRGQAAASFATQYLRPWLETASSSTQHLKLSQATALLPI